MNELEILRERIRARVVEESIPSLAIGVARGEEVLWEEAFGWADLEGRVPATPDTPYSLASITKPITATGLMVLVERGRIDLDRPINDYLGDTGVTARVGSAGDATVRRVANHTSGLPLHYHFFPVDEALRRPPVGETIRRYGNLVAPPGERYQYSNLGYGLLDHAIARASGRSFAAFMRTELFLPLGMTRSAIDVPPGLEPFQAQRYNAERERVAFYDFDHPGASAAYASARDLLRFGMFHAGARLPEQKQILSDGARAQMQEPTAAPAPGSGYGVGWRSAEEVPGYRVVGHNGGMMGVSTLLAFMPEHRLVVAALANASCELPYAMADEVFGLLLPEYGAAIRDVRAAQKAERERDEAQRGDPSPLEGEWRGAASTWEREIPVTLEVLRGGEIVAKVGDQLRTLLNDTRFREGRLTGRMPGDLGTEDSAQRPHHLHVDLQHRGEVLNGAISAVSIPGRRPGMALSHWIELRRG